LLLSGESKISPTLNEIPNCEKCGATRNFEMQLMPHLLSCLRVNPTHHQSNGEMDAHTHGMVGGCDEKMVDFGCVYIYTCSQSCWKDDDDIMRFEVAAIQPDPETVFLT
jgi:Programmed cell death protein 2, C-terminal putative domain.